MLCFRQTTAVTKYPRRARPEVCGGGARAGQWQSTASPGVLDCGFPSSGVGVGRMAVACGEAEPWALVLGGVDA